MLSVFISLPVLLAVCARFSPLIWQNLHLNALLKSLTSPSSSSECTPRRPAVAPESARHSEPHRRRHQTMVIDSRNLGTPPHTHRILDSGAVHPEDTTLDRQMAALFVSTKAQKAPLPTPPTSASTSSSVVVVDVPPPPMLPMTSSTPSGFRRTSSFRMVLFYWFIIDLWLVSPTISLHFYALSLYLIFLLKLGFSGIFGSCGRFFEIIDWFKDSDSDKKSLRF